MGKGEKFQIDSRQGNFFNFFFFLKNLNLQGSTCNFRGQGLIFVGGGRLEDVTSRRATKYRKY